MKFKSLKPRASVLIPTHNRPQTLALAIRSALKQSVKNLEVIVIGDGVTDAVRDGVAALQKQDRRIRFLDFPKGSGHGEPYRHDAIVAARSDAIFYLCDDDLFLRTHVADLLELLQTHNFVQSLNGMVLTSGEIDFYPADLSDPETIAWHLRTDLDGFYNSVSLTGTAHSRQFYIDTEKPWEATPAGRWPDHYQWCKMFSSPELRAATSTQMTTIQLPTSVDGRDEWSEEARLAELEFWAKIARSRGGQKTINELVRIGAHRRMELDKQTIYRLRTVNRALRNKNVG